MNWKWGTAFGIMAFVTLVSIVYAFVQQTIAKEARRDAEKQQVMAETQRKISGDIKAEADRQRLVAEKNMELYQTTLKELEKIKKKFKQ